LNECGRNERLEEGVMQFDGVKVFSATKAKEREELGERLTRWIDEHPTSKVVDTVVTQSSDHEFHCLTITIFYKNAASQTEGLRAAG
jgi:hypothetical protein